MTLAFALVKLLLIIKIIEPLAMANGPVTLWHFALRFTRIYCNYSNKNHHDNNFIKIFVKNFLHTSLLFITRPKFPKKRWNSSIIYLLR